MTYLVAQLVKNLPALWETWVQTLGWEDPLRRERLPTPVFWPGEFHGLYSPWGRKELDTTEQLSPSLSVFNRCAHTLQLFVSCLIMRKILYKIAGYMRHLHKN